MDKVPQFQAVASGGVGYINVKLFKWGKQSGGRLWTVVQFSGAQQLTISIVHFGPRPKICPKNTYI